MIQKLWTIARVTFIETIRQPIYGVLVLATALLLVLNVSLAAFTLEDDDRLLLDLGLSTLLLSGLFLSAFSAAGVFSREIENKTILTVVSKPVNRPLFVVGKFVGLLAAVFLAFYLCFLFFVLAQRHGVLQTSRDPWDAPVLVLGTGALLGSLSAALFFNYFFGKDFSTTAMAIVTPVLTAATMIVGKFNEHWEVIQFGSNYVGGQVILAAYLVMLMVMVTTVVALAASTRYGQVVTLLICTLFLAVSTISDYALGQFADSSTLASVAYRLFPNLGPFWVIEALHAATANTTITFHYVFLCTCYALLLTAAVLGLAICLFQRREVG